MAVYVNPASTDAVRIAGHDRAWRDLRTSGKRTLAGVLCLLIFLAASRFIKPKSASSAADAPPGASLTGAAA